mgnify:CR=1 FL=1
MFHLITGGSGSGKSEYAEQKLMEYASHSKRNKKRYYIATMMPFGKETEEKIARHRRLRAGKGFETIECYTDLKKAAEVLQQKRQEVFFWNVCPILWQMKCTIRQEQVEMQKSPFWQGSVSCRRSVMIW